MRQARIVALLVTLASLLTLAVVDTASASPQPATPQPKIVAVSSTAVCNIYPCSVTATLTYNEAVGFTADAYRAFTVTDLSRPSTTSCTVTSLSPSPVVGLANQLLLHFSCVVQQGDRMHLAYVAFLPPTPPTPGYVYSLALPHVPALSPQLFDWLQGPVICCPPNG
jgi:hypothetical protein